jgi:ABC-type transporter Mla MlaB component
VEEVPPPDAAVLHAVDECLVLSGALVIHEAQEQAARIRAALAAGVHRFDLSALRTIDTAGVQLLVALAREGDRCKPGLALLGCPAHVREAARSLGLSEALEPLFREAA